MEPKQNKRKQIRSTHVKAYFDHRKKFKQAAESAQSGLDRIEYYDRERERMWEPIQRAEDIERMYRDTFPGAGGDIRGMTKKLVESERYQEMAFNEPDVFEMGKTYQDIKLAKLHAHRMAAQHYMHKNSFIDGPWPAQGMTQYARDVFGPEEALVRNLKDRGDQIFGSLLLEDIREAHDEAGLQFDV